MTDEQSIEPAPRDMIAEANNAAEKLELLNKQLDEKLQRLERLQVESTLGGRAAVQVAKKEETNEEYADRIIRGESDG